MRIKDLQGEKNPLVSNGFTFQYNLSICMNNLLVTVKEKWYEKTPLTVDIAMVTWKTPDATSPGTFQVYRILLH